MSRFQFRVWDVIERLFIYCGLEDYPRGMYGGVTPQQYTGFLDRNGKEIYEGDIVRWNAGWFYTSSHVGEIKWITNGFYYVSEKNYCNSRICWLLDKNTDGVVIGNIFENPELSTSIPQ